MKYRVYTNESFESYIDKLLSSKRHKFEDRWDSLDFDEIEPKKIDIPTQVEVNDAVRQLDLVDDVAIKTGAQDVKVGSDGKLRLLDFDDDAKSRSVARDDKDNRVAGLDFDDKGKTVKVNDGGEKAAELDFDEKGNDVKVSKSNIGSIGSLDYDDDIDTSSIAASINDVYVSLKSDSPKIVKAMIKRYAADIKDENEIKEILLSHAIKLNLECLRIMCGDMKVVLSAKEKQLGFIDRNDIKEALDRFKFIAKKLTGEGNTYGLIPNAIVACDPDSQIKCMNIVDFLVTWLDLPITPIYFRGAVVKKCYDLSSMLYEQLPDGSIDTSILSGARGLLTRIKEYSNVPKSMLELLSNEITGKKYRTNIIGDFWILCLNNNYNKPIKNSGLSQSRIDLVTDYVEDNSLAAYQKLKKLLNLD